MKYLILLFISFNVFAQDVTKYETAGNYTFVVPANVYVLDGFLCSGGAGGGSSKLSSITAGGGGGVKQTSFHISVLPFESLSVTVGEGGLGGKTTGANPYEKNGQLGNASSVLATGRPLFTTGIATGGLRGTGELPSGTGGADYATSAVGTSVGLGGQTFNCNSGGNGGYNANGQDGGTGKVWLIY